MLKSLANFGLISFRRDFGHQSARRRLLNHEEEGGEMSRILRIIFHATAVAVLGYGIYYDVNFVKPPQEYLENTVKFAGRWKYLTFIDINVQCWFFIFCLINDLVGSDSLDLSKRSLTQKIRDTLFSSIVFPIGSFVCVSFWTLFIIDRNLVYPAELDSFIPMWLNHVMHTSILPFDIAELVISPHKYPSKFAGLLMSGAAMIAYTLWTFYIAYHTSHWVYPILEVLNWTYRILFILGCMLFAMLFYLVGNTVNSLVWRKSAITSPQKPSRKVKRKTN